MFDLLDLNFKQYTHPGLIFTVGNIADLLSVHPEYQHPWPDYLQSPVQLKEQVEDFRVSVNAAADGSRTMVAIRNKKRIDLEMSAVFMGQVIIMKYARTGNPAVLQNIGYTIKSHLSKSIGSRTAMGPPTDFFVKHHGTVSGTVLVKAKRVAVGGTYQLQICEDVPVSEGAWRDVGLFVHCKEIPVKDLEPWSQRCRSLVRNFHHYSHLDSFQIQQNIKWPAPL